MRGRRNQRFVPARAQDVFVPHVLVPQHIPLMPGSFAHGNVLRDNTIIPAIRYPDGAILVLDTDNSPMVFIDAKKPS
jgi:hypothetical protein